MKKNLESIINVVIGTAGHIDHGKSALVKRLTGIDPDRLPEEKTRGLTIDIGFSRVTLPGGQRVGIIDVPGHERLIKNMVAGATGIDFVLLVIAADDGVMPQTREHLAIMQLLGLRHGMVAVTKIDLVDEELLELVKDDIRETLQDTFLDGAPLFAVSSTTGQGIDQLIAALQDQVRALKPRDTTGVFRMPIQRAFSAKGFGTVVAGVPVNGRIRPGDTLEIVPGGGKGRVRGIQAYGEPTDMARAGHSSAVNLTDVDYRKVHRGMVLTEPGYFRPAGLYEARLRYLASNKRPLAHQTVIRLHTGTLEVLGKVYLLEKKQVLPGEETFVQFRLNADVVAVPGDRFILRLHSPLETIGGGRILSSSRWRLKLGKPHVVDLLRETESALADHGKWLCRILAAAGNTTLSERDLAFQAGLPLDEARKLAISLVESGEFRRASRAGLLLSARTLEKAEEDVLRAAADFFARHPRRLLLDKLQLRQKLKAGDVFFQDLLAAMAQKGVIREERENRIRFRDFEPRLGPEDEAVRLEVIRALEENPFSPPSPAEIASRSGLNAAGVQEIADLLVEEGEVLKLADDVYFHKKSVEQARRTLREFLEAHGTMTASDARQALGSTRKYGIPLLEYFDREEFTLRKGDLRELHPAARADRQTAEEPRGDGPLPPHSP